MLVTERGGHVAAMVSLAEREHFTGDPDAYVGELVIDRRMEGRGAGRALIAAAEKWAASRGLSRMNLQTGARNHRARRCYESGGVEEEEEEEEEEDIRLSRPVGRRW